MDFVKGIDSGLIIEYGLIGIFIFLPGVIVISAIWAFFHLKKIREKANSRRFLIRWLIKCIFIAALISFFFSYWMALSSDVYLEMFEMPLTDENRGIFELVSNPVSNIEDLKLEVESLSGLMRYEEVYGIIADLREHPQASMNIKMFDNKVEATKTIQVELFEEDIRKYHLYEKYLIMLDQYENEVQAFERENKR